MNTDQLALALGYAVMGIGGFSIIGAGLIGCALLSNRVQNHMVATLGDWKVFCEYRDWYHDRRRAAPAPPDRKERSPMGAIFEMQLRSER